MKLPSIMKLPSSMAVRIAGVIVLVVAVSQWASLTISRDLLATTFHQREIDKVKTLGNLIQSLVPEQAFRATLLAQLLQSQGQLGTIMLENDAERANRVADVLADAYRVSKVDVLTVTDRDGVVVYRAHDPARRGDREAAWGVDEALEGRGMVVSTADDTGVTIQAIEPIYGGRRVVGTVIVGSRLDSELLGQFSAALDANLALVSRSGKIVASSSSKLATVERAAIEEAFLGKIPVYRRDRAAHAMLAYLPLFIIDDAWVMVAQVDSTSAYALLDAASRDSFALALAIGLASVLLAVVVVHYALNPLRKLRARAELTLSELSGDNRIATPGDDIASVVLVLDTLTDRLMKRNQELAEAKHKADAASEAKSQFLANMSHEIRTPLNGVLGMAELLQGTPLNEVQAHYCRTLASSGRMLHELLRDILDLAKIEARGVRLERIDFDPVELATDAAAAFREAATTRGNEMVVDVAATLPTRVEGDPTRLRQVISNLLSNAVKFTQDGTVTFSVAPVDRGSDEGRVWLRFTVTDTGIGIAPEKLAGLFRPFVQADSSTTRTHGGSGLGLAISKHLVELMGGSVHVKSEVGRGTTFWCDLPYTVAAARVGELSAAPEPSVFSGRVLVAEDNPVNREVVGALLERLGVAVTVVEDGQQAVDAVAESTFDLVFMDCQMPVLDGYAAVAKIRALEQGSSEGRHVPIVALTAVASESDRKVCLAAGMDDYVSKPCSLQDLRLALGRWLTAGRSPSDPPASAKAPPPTDAPSDPLVCAPALNPRALKDLEAALPGKGATVVRNIIAAYLDDTPKRLRGIREAVAAGDPEALRKAAHALKSSSRNVGAETLAAMAETIEKLGKAGSLSGASDLARDAEAQYTLVEQELLRRRDAENEHVSA